VLNSGLDVSFDKGTGSEYRRKQRKLIIWKLLWQMTTFVLNSQWVQH
jgi:hypothetical protein